MQTSKTWVLGAALSLLAVDAATQPARAGDVSNAAVTCFVDTYAFDVPEVGSCSSIWRPGSANNPSTALFQVTGVGAGNYAYAWRDLENNTVPAGCGNAPYCEKLIYTDVYGDGQATLQVTITDLDTGAVRQVQATAFYYDGFT